MAIYPNSHGNWFTTSYDTLEEMLRSLPNNDVNLISARMLRDSLWTIYRLLEANGSQGFQGGQGFQGFGHQGAQGLRGETGLQGVQGIIGKTGNDGANTLRWIYGNSDNADEFDTSFGTTWNSGQISFNLVSNGADTSPIWSLLEDRLNNGFSVSLQMVNEDGTKGAIYVIEDVNDLVIDPTKSIVTLGNPVYSFGGALLPSEQYSVSWGIFGGAGGVQGFQGAQGFMGAQGTQGTIGLQGAQGLMGQTGFQGAVGADGNQGVQGVNGVIGMQGVQGIIGTQGNIGVEGLQGAQGVQGIVGGIGTQGSQGFIGLQGVQGEIGINGLQGFQGEIGLIGSQGAQGNIGLQGAQGLVGFQGVQGGDGVQGTQGDIGFQGAQGLHGFEGVQGAQGINGTQGVQGVQGVIGLQGRQGDIGAQGFNGLQGVQGTIGEIGLQGTQGNNGLVGAQGNTGLQGAQGLDGTNGLQGVQGLRGEDGTGINIAGTVPDYASLPTSGLNAGDAYLNDADGLLYIYDGVSFPADGDGVEFRGYQGFQGSIGLQGTQGNVGIQGTQGVIGLQGAQGVQGGIGINGLQGTQGFIGETGLQGTQGLEGSQGVQGTIGETGLQGAQGVQGVNGIQGTQGFIGITGAQGSVGVQGTQGFEGLQGVQGTIGETGLQGAQGNIGETGLQGVQGTIGETGLQGTQGSIGINGVQGAQGNIGLIGAQGNIGYQGSQGLIGINGLQGVQGINGTQGVQGVNGIDGVQGVQGIIGINGLQGVQGTQGSSGIQGQRGAQGFDGVQGLQGAQGRQGLIGITGNQGVQGTQGNIGVVGSQGVQGVQGNNGITGFQGAQGVQGVNGIQGVQGIKGADGTGINIAGTVPDYASLPTSGLNAGDAYLNDADGLLYIYDGVGFPADGDGVEFRGYQGFQGNIGLQGTQGNQGFIGQIGLQGSQGFDGAQGFDGTTGSQGVQGTQGTQGTQGNQGVQGVQGVIGFQGVQGVNGIQGIQGVNGIQGVQGIKGADGTGINIAGTVPDYASLPTSGLNAGDAYLNDADGLLYIYDGVGFPADGDGVEFRGYQGFQGNIGLQGAQGLSGIQGTQGVIGLQGTQGVQGTQGTQGNQGLQGAQGRQGLVGTTGSQGVQGTQGTQGNQGVQGTQGTQGNQGLQGAQGRQGFVGTTGSQGVQGTQGTQGNQGVQGIIGTTGTQGVQGTQGTQGNQGLQGAQGRQGLVGTTGSQGVQGTQGFDGSQGVQGTQGTQGNQGLQGAQGRQGLVGTTGSQGVQGVQGLIGTTGSQGVQGTQGFDGSQGVQGTQGTQGNQGLQGAQGRQGIVGTTGSQGVQGTQGFDGTQGVQGTQGTQGNQGLQGAQGRQGLVGTTGSQGVQGTQGTQGNQGVQGVIGITGNQGIQGAQGFNGNQGVQGTQGNQGLQGAQGRQGIVGTTGSQGVQGTQGTQGNQGLQGAQGRQGIVGTTGSQGVQGVTGNQGVQGTQGTQGNQGLQGAQGRQGIGGTTGSQGVQGTQGTQGNQGLQGVQGATGQDGVGINIAGSVPNYSSLPTSGLSAGDAYLNEADGLLYIYDGVSFPADGNGVEFRGYQGVQGTQGTQGNHGLQGAQGRQGIVGTTGSQGVQGTQGTQGNQGLQGVMGNQGFQGVQGVIGSQGVQGTQGTQGNQGLQGAQGRQGIVGTTGSQGVQGVIGTTGSQGVQGTQGTQGNQGLQGAQGRQGLTGVIGLQGRQGVQGFDGNQGVQGTQGTQGNQGFQGVQGTQGNQGLQGAQGRQGLVGTTGAQGVQGTQGTQGNQGVQGVQGTQGTQGNQGLQGAQGRQGIVGTTGSQGVQGVIGITGSQGVQGTQGTQGNQGLQGAQGRQGIVGTTGTQGLQGAQGRQGWQGVQGLLGLQGLQGVGIDALQYLKNTADSNSYNTPDGTKALFIVADAANGSPTGGVSHGIMIPQSSGIGTELAFRNNQFWFRSLEGTYQTWLQVADRDLVNANFIPYIGANQDADLGTHSLNAYAINATSTVFGPQVVGNTLIANVTAILNGLTVDGTGFKSPFIIKFRDSSENPNRIFAGGLAISDNWTDETKIPTNGIYSKGRIDSAVGFKVDGGAFGFLKSDGTIDTNTYLTSIGSHTHPWADITGTPTTLSGYGITDAVPSTRTITINGTTYNLSANRTWTIPTHDAVTLGTNQNGLSLSGQVLSLGLASTSTTGALSSTDWVNFNTAYGWGNHLGKYLGFGVNTSLPTTSPVVSGINANSLTNTIGYVDSSVTNKFLNSNGTLISFLGTWGTNPGDYYGFQIQNIGSALAYPQYGLRTQVGGVWSAWETIATREWMNGSYLPLAGGTMTGTILMGDNNSDLIHKNVGTLAGGWARGISRMSSTNHSWQLGSTGSIGDTTYGFIGWGTTNNYWGAIIKWTPDGKVGINKASSTIPVATLDVDGNVRIMTVASQVGNVLTLGTNNIISQQTPTQIVTSGGGITTETDPTVPSHVKSITTTNIANWNAGVNTHKIYKNLYSSSAYATTGKIKLRLGSTVFSGLIKIHVKGSYSSANANGYIELEGGVGSTPGVIWNNQVVCTNAIGNTVDNFYVNPTMLIDATGPYFEIYKINAANNSFFVDVEMTSLNADIHFYTPSLVEWDDTATTSLKNKSIYGLETDVSNKANINGDNTVGGTWKIGRIENPALTTTNKQLIHSVGDELYIGNPQLGGLLLESNGINNLYHVVGGLIKKVWTEHNLDPSIYIPNTYLIGRTLTDANLGNLKGVDFNFINGLNRPIGMTNGALLSMHYDITWGAQLAADWRTNKWSVRSQEFGVWKSWENLATEGWVTTQISTSLGNYLPLAGGTMTGTILMGGGNLDLIHKNIGTIAGGWAKNIVRMSSTNHSWAIGSYGTAADTVYGFIGWGATNNYNNALIKWTPDGKVSINKGISAVPLATLDVDGNLRVSTIASQAGNVLTLGLSNIVSQQTPAQIVTNGGGVLSTRTLTINGTTFDLSANRTWTIPTHDALTLGVNQNGLSLSGQVLSLGLASATTTGALSSTNWTTFNNKQNALNGTGVLSFVGTTPSYTAGTAGQLYRRNLANTGYEFFTPNYITSYQNLATNNLTQSGIVNRTYNVNGGTLNFFNGDFNIGGNFLSNHYDGVLRLYESIAGDYVKITPMDGWLDIKFPYGATDSIQLAPNYLQFATTDTGVPRTLLLSLDNITGNKILLYPDANNRTFTVSVNGIFANSNGNITVPISDQWQDVTPTAYEYLTADSLNYGRGKGINTAGGYASKTQFFSGNTVEEIEDDVEHVVRLGPITKNINLILPNPVDFPDRVITISNHAFVGSSGDGRIIFEASTILFGSTIIEGLNPSTFVAVNSYPFPYNVSWVTIKSIDVGNGTGDYLWIAVMSDLSI
jgi:hypothetical protein